MHRCRYNLLQASVEKPVAWLFARDQRRCARRGEPLLDPSGRLAAGLQTQIKMRLFNVVAVLTTYLIWIIMVRPYVSV